MEKIKLPDSLHPFNDSFDLELLRKKANEILEAETNNTVQDRIKNYLSGFDSKYTSDQEKFMFLDSNSFVGYVVKNNFTNVIPVAYSIYLYYAHRYLKTLNDGAKKASDAYYNKGDSFMTDMEYDALTDEIARVEKHIGYKLTDSVSENVGAAVSAVSALKKVHHEEKALSLDKTKDRQALACWLGKHPGVLSWKMDGLTVVVTYDNGALTSAVTRGNGEVGEDITHNAPFFKGLPQTIPLKNHLVVRGEAVMTFADFNNVNAQLPPEEQYKNPRNLASGTVRALDPTIVRDRGISFYAFEMVTSMHNSFSKNLDELEGLGFNVVQRVVTDGDNLVNDIGKFETAVANLGYPTDGLVVQMDDIAYAKSLGTTGKFPRGAKAFKWKDEVALTTIRQIVWQPSRTGLINPVAVFDPVELEGTTVSRATCNNISFMQKHNLAIGSKIEVYKANMIIPTIARNTTMTQGDYRTSIPRVCPCCGQPTQIAQTKEAYVLMCNNPSCSAKNIKGLVHFVSRDAMNIMGIAESTIDLLNQNGYLKNPLDFFTLYQHPEIAELEGLGQGSFKNMVESVQKASDTTLDKYIYAWGIDQIGKRASKDLATKCNGDPKIFVQAMQAGHDWTDVDGFGEVMNQNLQAWWSNPMNSNLFIKGLSCVNFKVAQTPKVQGNNSISGKTFCVTGSVNIFPNRSAVGEYIEARGGKLASSVSKNTDYLMTNDTTSGSSKNKKAAELGVPIITEEQLISMGGGM